MSNGRRDYTIQVTQTYVNEATTLRELYDLLSYSRRDRQLLSIKKFGVHLLSEPILRKIADLEFEQQFFSTDSFINKGDKRGEDS
jgi:hypothetical protein